MPSSRPSPSYVLGIDGLPLGDRAAVAVGGRVVAEMVVAGGLLFDRMVDGVRIATEQRGNAPAEVRLLCVDAGDDGAELHRARAWLADRSIALVVLDPAELMPLPQPPPSVTDDASPAGRSASRARMAALW